MKKNFYHRNWLLLKNMLKMKQKSGKNNIIQMEKESDLSKSDKKSIVIENLITVAIENDINRRNQII